MSAGDLMLVLVLSLMGLVLLITTWTVGRLARRYPETRWDWSRIDTEDAALPPDFIWGVATSSYQVEGGSSDSNWSHWERGVTTQGRPRILDGTRCGEASDHWHRYPEDVRRMKEELGVNSYRFSLAWDKLEPEPGRFDPEIIAHYHRVLDALEAANIAPMMTLHHFTHPQWFEHLGSFERQENLQHFERFVRRMAQEYGHRVTRWCTINEPAPFAIMGWGLGAFPPGHRSVQRAAQVLCRLMEAHLVAARSLKEHGGEHLQVALVKNIFQLDPWQRWNPVHWLIARVADQVYNESILSFLRTGVFRARVPGLVRVEEQLHEGPVPMDFLGLNYYSHILCRLRMTREHPFEVLCRPGDTATDMPFTVYPEGFYRALTRVAELGYPVIVTENGIADARDDRRADWITRYLYALHVARQAGCDVRGYHYWSLLDNFEWADGFEPRFGLYAVDYATQERRLRPGALSYQAIIARSGSPGLE